MYDRRWCEALAFTCSDANAVHTGAHAGGKICVLQRSGQPFLELCMIHAAED